MEHWMEKYNHAAAIDRKKYLDEFEPVRGVNWTSPQLGVSPLQLHATMFVKTLEMLGNEEQIAEFLPQAKALRIIGSYAQTELGHGSNVGGLETTATFDEKTDEWVIHTPTITATKFWPGALGLMSNHSMVFARCLVGENDYGPQPFLVPIRSFEDHMPFPGVSVGDVGAKFGFNSVDNGYLSFDNYRIPRKMMM